MFESKNASPASISLIIAISLSTIAAILLGLFAGFNTAIAGFVMILLLGFFLSKYLIEQFVHRKIKLIYKFISQTKSSKREEFFQKNTQLTFNEVVIFKRVQGKNCVN